VTRPCFTASDKYPRSRGRHYRSTTGDRRTATWSGRLNFVQTLKLNLSFRAVWAARMGAIGRPGGTHPRAWSMLEAATFLTIIEVDIMMTVAKDLPRGAQSEESSFPNAGLNPLRPDMGCPLRAGTGHGRPGRAPGRCGCAVTSLLQRGCGGAVY